MRTAAILKRVLRQITRDRRTLALVLVAPILVLTLLWVIMGGGESTARLDVVDMPAKLVSALREQKATVNEVTAAQAEADLKADKVDAVLSFQPAPDKNPPISLSVKLEGSDPSAARTVMTTIMRSASAMAPQGSMQPTITRLHGSPTDTAFDHLGPVLLGVLVFFFVYLVSGVSFVRERTTGTLERMLATPVRQWEIVLGYAGAFSVLAIIQSSLVSLYCVNVLGMRLAGSMIALLAINSMLALSALAVGMLLSAFSRNEFQMIQFIPLIIVPQFLFSGLVPLDSMPGWVQAASYVMPLTYAGHGLRAVMARGESLGAVMPDVLALGAFVCVMLGLNIIALLRLRKAR